MSGTSQQRMLLEADAAALDIMLSNLNAVAFDLGYYKVGGDAHYQVASSVVAHVEHAEKILRAERTAVATRLANLPKE